MTDRPAPETEELPAPSNPMAVARRLLPDWQNENGAAGVPALARFVDALDRHLLAEMDEAADAQGHVQAAGARHLQRPAKDGQPEIRDWAPTKQKISNLLDALGAITLLPTDTDAPSWVDAGRRGQGRQPDRGL